MKGIVGGVLNCILVGVFYSFECWRKVHVLAGKRACYQLDNSLLAFITRNRDIRNHKYVFLE